MTKPVNQELNIEKNVHDPINPKRNNGFVKFNEKRPRVRGRVAKSGSLAQKRAET